MPTKGPFLGSQSWQVGFQDTVGGRGSDALSAWPSGAPGNACMVSSGLSFHASAPDPPPDGVIDSAVLSVGSQKRRTGVFLNDSLLGEFIAVQETRPFSRGHRI